ncbi:alpha/beta fold hydrolase [Alicyclobacillus fodiniaquatilis]|uniref:Alpha/beta fold hydrolase n=1 Tax=Alicyclobacillus fodiniaquatilis TaxID=1661150 RepID=A0ABW4JLF3_9BACL
MAVQLRWPLDRFFKGEWIVPYADSNQADIYYEVMGEGEPLILIMGLGGNLDWWGSGFRKRLAQRRQVIACDNRAAGRTKSEKMDFSMEDMAEDVIALMDHLQCADADVFGMSMGGMIAQEMALRHPERVRRLILGCTSCGGKEQIRPTEAASRLLTMRPSNLEEAIMHQLQLLFPPDYIAKNQVLLKALSAVLGRQPMTHKDFMRQYQAIERWQGTFQRLPSLSQPTLILHGEEDILLPVGNSTILADRLPNAKRMIYPGCGHGFVVQMTAQVFQALEDFLII